MIDLLNPIHLAPPFDTLGPMPVTDALEDQIERVRGAYNLLGYELYRLAELVAGPSPNAIGPVARGSLDR